MRRVSLFVALAVSISGPAVANNINTMGFTDIARTYDFKMWCTAEGVLTRLRTVSRSNDRFDRQLCANGMAILKDAHADSQSRRAAGSAVAE